MTGRSLIFSLFVILLPLHSNLVKADEWDLSKATFPAASNHLQKWCSSDGKLVRYSNTEVTGYSPCGELKNKLVCDASGKKLITSGAPPYGFKDCSDTPRIFIERIGPPLPEKENEEESITLAKNNPTDPNEQIANGLKTYQDYISSLDQLVDEEPSTKRKPKANLESLTGGSISPTVLTEALKMLSQMGQ